MPIVAPFGLGVNGNAITVSPALYAKMVAAADGNILDPMVSARALKRVVDARKAKGEAPLAFGMTFPFSTHNYHIRFWMAAGGVDPDEDVQLVVLPPPYMVDSLASGHVDGFCVGAPWNSVAVDLGVGVILFVCEILAGPWEAAGRARRLGRGAPGGVLRLCHRKAAAFIEDETNREEVTAILAAPNRIDVAGILAVPNRVDVAAEVIRRTLDGRMKVSPDGVVRIDDRYLLVGRDGAARPDPVQAAWLYAQMVRWARHRSRPSCWPPPRASCAPISAMPPCSATWPSLVIQRTASGHSPAPPSIPTTSRDTSRAGRSSAPVEATTQHRLARCTAQSFRSARCE